MMRKTMMAIGALALCSTTALALTLEEFRALPDNRVAVRTALGVRSARALGSTQVELELGLSATAAAENPTTWRVVSDDDPNYAYDKFVRPVQAAAKRVAEAEAPAGCPFESFEKRVVTLRLPQPMQPGKRYDFIAQGSANGEVAVGGHSAQGFVYGDNGGGAAFGQELAMAALGLRRVEPVGAGVLMLEFGPGFASAAGDRPSNYTVTVGGKPAKVVGLGRISRVDTYLPQGWPFQAIPMHELFLQVLPSYQDGDTVAVQAAKGVSAGDGAASFRFDSSKTFSNSIKVNQVGYLADSPVKTAYLGRWLGSFSAGSGTNQSPQGEQEFWNSLKGGGEAPAKKTSTGAPTMGPALAFPVPPSFQVVPEQGGAPVFSGVAKLIHRAGALDEGVFPVDHSGENVYLLDFTPLKTPGRYAIVVPGVGCSLPFSIGDDVYARAFKSQARGLYAQRCGQELAPPLSAWRRLACHKQGITLTTQLKNEPHDIGKDLPTKAVYQAASATPPPSDLDSDADLAARYRFGGDFKDASGHGLDLTPLSPKPNFSPAAPRQFQAGEVYGPSANGAASGASGRINLDISKGLCVAFWFKKTPKQKYSGFFKLGVPPGNRFLLDGSWGVPILSAGKGQANLPTARMNRPADGAWHHLAAVLDPATNSPRCMSLYDNGSPVASTAAGELDEQIAGPLLIACLNGDEAGGAYFRDFRIYSRALSPAEVKTLAAPHPAETPVVIQAFGGHHDAGDYNPRSHLDVAQKLMDAYEMAPHKFRDGQLDIPEQDNGLPDILDEAYWALRLWIGLQDEDGGVHNGTESAGDPSFVQTVELDNKGDYAYAKDAEGSLLFAGAMAQASRLWRLNGKDAEADDFLRRAVKAYDWAMAHPLLATDAAFYGHHVAPPKAYAAAQLLHSTGDTKYNRDFLAACVWTKKPDADIEEYRSYDMRAAAWAYASCPDASVDSAVREAVRKAIVKKADTFVQLCSTMAYAFVRHPWAPINWGTGAYENWLDQVVQAYQLTRDPKYLRWIIHTCDNTLGANPLNRSYIVGLGTRTVRAPLHSSRYSQAGEVAEGMQVQGPNHSGEGYRVQETAYPELKKDFAPLQNFVDCHFAIVMDEGTVSSQAQSMAVFGLLLPDQP